MAEVISVFENAGMEDVSSVLASGNIIFVTDKDEVEARNRLEKKMSAYFSYESVIFVQRIKNLIECLENNPFEKDTNFHVYVFITEKGGAEEIEQAFKKTERILDEEGQKVKDYFFWKVPKGNTVGSPFGKILGNKAMKEIFTSRNINTIEKILKK